jgi:hypothetical protein
MMNEEIKEFNKDKNKQKSEIRDLLEKKMEEFKK